MFLFICFFSRFDLSEVGGGLDLDRFLIEKMTHLKKTGIVKWAHIDLPVFFINSTKNSENASSPYTDGRRHWAKTVSIFHGQLHRADS